MLRSMTIFRRILLLLACAQVLDLAGAAEPATERVDGVLPKAGITEAAYVQIERDPAVDDYVRRMRDAREKNPEWFLEYSKKHQTSDTAPLPYHENFGVTKEEYERFSQPMNHYREVQRKQIEIERRDHDVKVQLDFQGDDLLLTKVTLNLADGSAATRELLQRKEFVDLAVASLPPGPHRGVAYGTANARFAATKTRESLVIGELKDKNSGIIHYALNTRPGPDDLHAVFQVTSAASLARAARASTSPGTSIRSPEACFLVSDQPPAPSGRFGAVRCGPKYFSLR